MQEGGVETLAVSDMAAANAIGSIEFLNLDVEGAELSVLEGIDFDCHAPKLICVEIHHISDLADIRHNPVAQYLLSRGYVAVAATVINFFFMRKTSLDPGKASPQG